ncbi:tetratricopeptide repeat protein [Longimicrobium sp.]|uniref:tetratricopeptide repeat protein n=1 Tax=Longimicrobium sp. TaxID=2029185 RepID=UPI002BD1F7D5|nr:tetratricopeptide repeat protein [Longimicrobium sp.]HSU14036.1 tetratricopeptide repeat protein [Longimicrobium sp.]
MDAPTAPVLSLDEARALRASGQWQPLAERTTALGDEELFREPELAFLSAVGHRRIGRTTRALELLRQVEPEARRRGDQRLLAEVVNLTGIVLWESGRSAEAEVRFGELLESAVEWGDEEATARACNNLGVLANVRGRRDLALTYYQRALAAYQRLGNVGGLSQTHHNLGISYRDLRFDREADAHFGRAVELAEQSQQEDVVALAEVERANLRVRWGDGRLAGEMARRALERFRRISDPTGAAQAIRVLGLAARAEERDDDAAARFDEALEIARTHDDALLRAEVQRDRGTLLRDRGDLAAAREALADSMENFAQIGAAAEAEAIRGLIDALDG